MTKTIEERVKYILEVVENKKLKLGISYPIEIVAVSKTFPSTDVIKVINAGIENIGENKVQEAEKKFLELKDLNFKKHLLGHLQSNKVNKAIELFDVIQSIDSFELAERINKRLSKKLDILIEVNTSGEESKFGIKPEEVVEITGKILELNNIEIKGFMTIGPNTDDEREIRKAFRKLYEIREKAREIYRRDFLHLSMGMSEDFEIAIEEGATILRLGRIIFGERNYSLPQN